MIICSGRAMAPIGIAMLSMCLACRCAQGGAGVETIRERLVTTAVELKEMADKAGKRGSPRLSQVVRYVELQPWQRNYAGLIRGKDSEYFIESRDDLESIIATHADLKAKDAVTPIPRMLHSWPTMEDAPALRILLLDKDSNVRALAVEALASLQQLEDIPRAAALLNDNAGAPRFLSLMCYPWGRIDHQDADPLVRDHWWVTSTVRDCAAAALMMMTGEHFFAGQFDVWWARNQPAEEHFWYWRERVRRELRPFERMRKRSLYLHSEGERTVSGWHEREKKLLVEWEPREAEIRAPIMRELRKLSPELEAKMRLLAVDDPSRANTLFQGQYPLRLDEARMLELLQESKRWPDVVGNWELEMRLLQGLCSTKSPLMKPGNVARLQAIMAENKRYNWVLALAISRLLPAANAGQLNDPNTRDGWLRQAFATENDLFLKFPLIEELLETGLPLNRLFIEQAFFAEQGPSSGSDLRQTVLQALGKPPLTREKRELLCDLLLDPRFEAFWHQPDIETRQDMKRRYAIWSVNAHARKELISPYSNEEYDLANPNTSAKALANIRTKIKTLRDDKVVH